MTRLAAEYTLTIGGVGTGIQGCILQAFKYVNLGVKSPSLEFHSCSRSAVMRIAMVIIKPNNGRDCYFI